MGLSDDWVKKVEEANQERRHLYLIKRTENKSVTAEVLKELDLVLSVNGKTITKISGTHFYTIYLLT